MALKWMAVEGQSCIVKREKMALKKLQTAGRQFDCPNTRGILALAIGRGRKFLARTVVPKSHKDNLLQLHQSWIDELKIDGLSRIVRPLVHVETVPRRVQAVLYPDGVGFQAELLLRAPSKRNMILKKVELTLRDRHKSTLKTLRYGPESCATQALFFDHRGRSSAKPCLLPAGGWGIFFVNFRGLNKPAKAGWLESRLLLESPAGLKRIIHQAPVEPYLSEVPFILPVEGAWMLRGTPSPNLRYRRRLNILRSSYHATQRYAYDLQKIKADGSTYSGRGLKREDYHSFNQPVYAMAGGKVIFVKNDAPDQEVVEARPWSKFLLAGKGSASEPGNRLIIRHEGDRFSFYGHLKQGSIKVKPGDEVRAGQNIARVGNSGASRTPHLYVHLATGPSYSSDRGLPLIVTDYRYRRPEEKRWRHGGHTVMMPKTIVRRRYFKMITLPVKGGLSRQRRMRRGDREQHRRRGMKGRRFGM